MNLVRANEKEFKDLIYPEYIKLFPAIERKPYVEVKRLLKKKMFNIFKIMDEDKFVGFIMAITVKESKHVLLDYFAILSKYQSKGYGSKAIKMLKEEFKEYDGIY